RKVETEQERRPVDKTKIHRNVWPHRTNERWCIGEFSAQESEQPGMAYRERSEVFCAEEDRASAGCLRNDRKDTARKAAKWDDVPEVGDGTGDVDSRGLCGLRCRTTDGSERYRDDDCARDSRCAS